MESIQILSVLLLIYEVVASCTEPRHDQQYFCRAQNAFTAYVDDVTGPPGDPFDRTYAVTVRRVYKGTNVSPNTTTTLYGRSTSCGPTILDLKKYYKIYARTNGPRLEIISHEEIPPAFEGRIKMYDCSCQIEIHATRSSNSISYEDDTNKCIVTTSGRDCQFRNGYCKKTNNLCTWKLFPRAQRTMNCIRH
ncbi:uncharacterized protein LOC134239469 [Saccostrea cucullata]|uniref:uncharacterized protein LOC134239469 n=1 Tax=Saccostrea cuccullata TaxID=36930 RepID=UPI002ED3A688